MNKREELEMAVTVARNTYIYCVNQLKEFEALTENNVFYSLPEALSAVEDKLMREAFNDCEGADNCGAPKYTQGFMVDDIKYLGTLTVEYSRYDKTYYYIDAHKFEYEILK